MGEDRRSSGGAGSEETPGSTAPHPETIKLILDYKKDDPRDQLHDSEQLDTKLAAVFTVATVVLGFAARLPDAGNLELPVVLGQTTSEPTTLHIGLAGLLVRLIAICWVVVALCAVRHLRTRTYARPLEAGVLWERYRHREPDEVRIILVRDIARADSENSELLSQKARLLNAAVVATGIESTLLALALVLGG